jgi:beta-lactamase class A
MVPMVSRRGLMIGASAVLAATRLRAAEGGVQGRLHDLETDIGGRLAVAALDTETDRRIDYGSARLMPICSTFKMLLVGAVLAKADRGKERLDRPLKLTKDDILDYAPAAKLALPKGEISVEDACAAAIMDSDNTAANLLMATLGGPGAVTLYARELGDKTTHLDRVEPFLNEAMPGDARDVTSAAAMLNDMGVLLLQDALSPASRGKLVDWMVRCKTGGARLRAGLPIDWKVADKTGTGERGTTNDIAVVWPPGRKPLLIAAYLTGTGASASDRNTLLADIARITVAEFGAAS